MSAVVTARGLSARYAGQTVLELDAFQVGAGRTLALLGPNGAGKSTLLRLLGLLELPAAGDLLLFGEMVTRVERQRLGLRRRMATVFQDPLLIDRSVRDNVALGLRFRGLTTAAASARVTRWLERFGIAALAERPAGSLSGGEARRVSLARAFVLEPELLLLDEPFAGLDHHGREALGLELEGVLRESRISTILVTHDRTEALMLADEAMVLMGGRARQRGPVRDVLARPADAAVGRFLGVENLIAATVAGPELLRLEGTGITLPGMPVSAPRVLLCFRAEEVHFLPAGVPAGPERLQFPARVTRVVPVGLPYRVHLDAGFPVVAMAARHTLDRLGLAPGAEATVAIDRDAIHIVPDDGHAMGH